MFLRQNLSLSLLGWQKTHVQEGYSTNTAESPTSKKTQEMAHLMDEPKAHLRSNIVKNSSWLC